MLAATDGYELNMVPGRAIERQFGDWDVGRREMHFMLLGVSYNIVADETGAGGVYPCRGTKSSPAVRDMLLVNMMHESSQDAVTTYSCTLRGGYRWSPTER